MNAIPIFRGRAVDVLLVVDRVSIVPFGTSVACAGSLRTAHTPLAFHVFSNLQVVMSAADDAAKLLGKVIDKMDRVLFEGDLQFREEADWEAFAEKLRALIFEYYDDLAGEKDDPDFDPEAPQDSTSSSESESLATEEELVDGTRKRKAVV